MDRPNKQESKKMQPAKIMPKRMKPKTLGPMQAPTPPDTSQDDAQAQANVNRLLDLRRADNSPIPTLEQQERMRRQKEESDMDTATDKAAQDATRRSMGTFQYAGGGSVSSASSRADGCAQRGKTKGRMI
jgi:hypothetical protein